MIRLALQYNEFVPSAALCAAARMMLPTMPNRIKFTPRARKRFIQTLRDTCNISAAARTVPMSRRNVYELREKFPDFAAEMDEAIETATDMLEAEARRRGMHGYDEPVFYKGKKVAAVRRYSDHLLEQLLKAHRPERFRERYDVNVRGKLTLEDAVAAAQPGTGSQADRAQSPDARPAGGIRARGPRHR